MPLLRFVVGLSPAQAAGTCILAVFFTTVGGSYRHYRLGHLRARTLVSVMVAGAMATAVCSWAFTYLCRRPQWLDLGMGLAFALISARMIQAGFAGSVPVEAPEEKVERDRPIRSSLAKKVTIGTTAGVLPGLLGIGTGAVLVPAFSLWLRLPIKVAMGCSLACFCCNALVSATFKAAQGYVVLAVAVPICSGTLLGSNLGALLNKRFSSRFVRVLFGLLFAYVSLKFLLLVCEVKI